MYLEIDGNIFCIDGIIAVRKETINSGFGNIVYSIKIIYDTRIVELVFENADALNSAYELIKSHMRLYE